MAIVSIVLLYTYRATSGAIGHAKEGRHNTPVVLYNARKV